MRTQRSRRDRQKWANLFEFSARHDAPQVPGALAPLRITPPDGRTIQAQATDASALLSAVLGRLIQLIP
jgi:hypothetical protein